MDLASRFRIVDDQFRNLLQVIVLQLEVFITKVRAYTMQTTEHTLRQGLPPLPDRIKRLPVDERGYPVPWFVSWIDGKPEFRAADTDKMARAISERLCWVCGEPLGKFMVFVIGPMCAVNRISGEPPAHKDCAEFSAMGCPFLTKPHMVRREGNMPDKIILHESSIARNPGVTLLWTTLSYKLVKIPTGVLFDIGDPVGLECYKEGRKAFAHEVRESIDSGFPTLLNAAENQIQKDEAIKRRNGVYKLLGC